MSLLPTRPAPVLFRCSALALLLATAQPAHAQAAPPGVQAPPDNWNVQLELGFNGASGNSSFSILRTGARVKHLRTDVTEMEMSTLVRFGKSDGKVIANDQRLSLKLDVWPQDTWSPFVFADASRDIIRKLDFRSNGGAGVKYTFWRSGKNDDASVSGALIWDYQNFRVAPGSTDAQDESLARWSFRTKGTKTLGTTTTIENTTFWQPVWNHSMDYVLTVTTSLSTKVLSNVSLSVEHEYLHDSVPPPDVRPDDQKFSVLFKLAL